MPKHTPFFEQLSPYNETGIWKNWSGYLVAANYQYSISSEYYAIRNAVAVFDTSPLFKYRFSGKDAKKLLAHALVRDIRKCKPGQAQYTLFCDADGFVIQDGVILNLGDEYLLTSGERALRYFRQIAREHHFTVQVDDVTDEFGILAVQGPLSHDVLSQLTDVATQLKYFQCGKAKTDPGLIVSRTGFTGDLGYEVWIPRSDAASFFGKLMAAGEGYNITPIGSTALKMARVEAGLLLMDVDFHSSRYAWASEQKETPIELGFEWMLRGFKKTQREFVGRKAIENELSNKTTRWTTVGLDVDVADYEQLHRESGILPPKSGVYKESTLSVYRPGSKEWDYAGYVSSFFYSSLLKRPIAIAKLPLDLAKPGTKVDVEFPVIRRPKIVKATVTSMPFYDPERKIAPVNASKQEAANVK